MVASTFSALHVHLVFSTKGREPWIVPAIEERLWSRLGGIAKRHAMVPLQIGGIEDHVHALIGLPPTLTVSRAAQLLKGASSHWIHDTMLGLAGFAWQDGYGAFTVSHTALAEVAAYIRNQRAHHRKRAFPAEYRLLLEKHGFEVDDRFFLG